MGGLFGGGPSGATKGAASAAENVAGQDVLPQAGALINFSAPLLQQYAGYLQSLMSPDASTRMEAIAPTIADQTALAVGEKAQLANLPRGGESAYLNSLIDQNTATAIGNALSQQVTQAAHDLGQLGEYGTSTALTSELGAGALFNSAGSVLNNTNTSGIFSNLSSLADLAGSVGGAVSAGAAAGAGGGSIGSVIAAAIAGL